MSLQGGSMSFQETAPSAMKFRDQTVAPVSASTRGSSQPAASGAFAFEATSITASSLDADTHIPGCLLGCSQLSIVCTSAVGGSQASVACTALIKHQ